jgi:hypothetical protein
MSNQPPFTAGHALALSHAALKENAHGDIRYCDDLIREAAAKGLLSVHVDVTLLYTASVVLDLEARGFVVLESTGVADKTHEIGWGPSPPAKRARTETDSQ